MDEKMKSRSVIEQGEGRAEGLPRRKFFKVAGIGALAYPLLIQTARADDITPPTLKAMEKQYADVAISDQEAAGLAPVLDAFTKGIRGIDVNEEIEPAIVFRRRKEK